jgi:hypothetical protein
MDAPGNSAVSRSVTPESSLPAALERLHSALIEKQKKIDEFKAIYTEQQNTIHVLRSHLGSGLELATGQLDAARRRCEVEELQEEKRQEAQQHEHLVTATYAHQPPSPLKH